MGHYDNCREGYCAKCGAAPGNFVGGVCSVCNPPKRRAKAPTKPKPFPPTLSEYDAAVRIVTAYEKYKE